MIRIVVLAGFLRQRGYAEEDQRETGQDVDHPLLFIAV
jgi:hypothetical protein